MRMREPYLDEGPCTFDELCAEAEGRVPAEVALRHAWGDKVHRKLKRAELPEQLSQLVTDGRRMVVAMHLRRLAVRDNGRWRRELVGLGAAVDATEIVAGTEACE